MKKKSLIIASIIMLIDQIIKILIDNYFVISKSKKIIKNFFYLTKVFNYGASWSILTGYRILLIIISIVAFIILYKYQKRFKNRYWNILSFGFIYGGLIGNFVDRLFRGYVIDYIELRFGSYIFPVFNLADILLVIGFALLIISVIKGDDKDESNS